MAVSVFCISKGALFDLYKVCGWCIITKEKYQRKVLHKMEEVRLTSMTSCGG